jgi:hypothetical protein
MFGSTNHRSNKFALPSNIMAESTKDEPTIVDNSKSPAIPDLSFFPFNHPPTRWTEVGLREMFGFISLFPTNVIWSSTQPDSTVRNDNKQQQ